ETIQFLLQFEGFGPVLDRLFEQPLDSVPLCWRGSLFRRALRAGWLFLRSRALLESVFHASKDFGEFVVHLLGLRGKLREVEVDTRDGRENFQDRLGGLGEGELAE